MTGLRHMVRRISQVWTPGYTVAVIVVIAIAIGFLPFVKMGLVVNGVFIGAIIALGAIGPTLIYGILNFANVAHGDYMTVGAYTGLFIVASILQRLGIEGNGLGPFTFGYPLLIALPIAVAAVAAMAIVLDALVYREAAGPGRERRSGVHGLAGSRHRAARSRAANLGRRNPAIPAGDAAGVSPAHGRSDTAGRHLYRHRRNLPCCDGVPGAESQQNG